MQAVLKKIKGLWPLAALAIVAILAAIGLMKAGAILLAPYTVPVMPEFTKTAKRTTPSSRFRNLSKPIVDRCLFGCSDEAPVLECPDGCPDGFVCDAGECIEQLGNDVVSSDTPVLSDLSIKLVGVMVARNAEYSQAMVKDGAESLLVGIGQQIQSAEVVEIHRDRIILKRNGRLEYIRLEDSMTGNPGRTKARPVPEKPVFAKKELKPSKKKEPLDLGGVLRISGTEFELDRSAVASQLSDPKKLAGQATVVPNYDANGSPAGIKLTGVRKNSIYTKIGLQSGDVVSSIDGVKVKNQAHAFELLDKLRSKNSASITVQSRGAAKTINYKVK